MHIGIISDIHGNRAALEAVLEDIQQHKCVKILCCGDVVGYGAHPAACIEIVRTHNISCVRGNHDDFMLNSERLAKLRKEVGDSIRWTRKQLTEAEKQWVGTLPMQRNYAGLEFIHASHAFYPPWPYIINQKAACANFIFQKTRVTFHGHTHVPLLGLHKRGSLPKIMHLSQMALPPHEKCLVNVGSVGQPRDKNPDAAYAVFDMKSREFKIHRVAYDNEKAAEDIRSARLPEKFAQRLLKGR
ncbi:MAG: metallophosphoesterase family protein [Lentisphaeria bacterium]